MEKMPPAAIREESWIWGNRLRSSARATRIIEVRTIACLLLDFVSSHQWRFCLNDLKCLANDLEMTERNWSQSYIKKLEKEL
jgi:hypothetical protein